MLITALCSFPCYGIVRDYWTVDEHNFTCTSKELLRGVQLFLGVGGGRKGTFLVAFTKSFCITCRRFNANMSLAFLSNCQLTAMPALAKHWALWQVAARLGGWNKCPFSSSRGAPEKWSLSVHNKHLRVTSHASPKKFFSSGMWFLHEGTCWLFSSPRNCFLGCRHPVFNSTGQL